MAEASVIARAGEPASVIAGFIMIIIPQLLVMAVAAVDAKEVTVEYAAFMLMIKDCAVALTSSEEPGAVVADEATDDIRGFWLVVKSLQS